MKNLILVIIVSISFAFTSCNQKANAKNADTAAVVQEVSVAPSLVDLDIDEVDFDNLSVYENIQRVSMKQNTNISNELFKFASNEIGATYPLDLYANDTHFILFLGVTKNKVETYYSVVYNKNSSSKKVNEIEKSLWFKIKE